MTDEQLLALIREHWETLEEALGDARAYRVDDGSEDPRDHQMAAQYKETATALGMEPSW